MNQATTEIWGWNISNMPKNERKIKIKQPRSTRTRWASFVYEIWLPHISYPKQCRVLCAPAQNASQRSPANYRKEDFPGGMARAVAVPLSAIHQYHLRSGLFLGELLPVFPPLFQTFLHWLPGVIQTFIKGLALALRFRNKGTAPDIVIGSPLPDDNAIEHKRANYNTPNWSSGAWFLKSNIKNQNDKSTPCHYEER